MKVRQNHKRIMRMIARHNGFNWYYTKVIRDINASYNSFCDKLYAILEKKYPCSSNTESSTTKAS